MTNLIEWLLSLFKTKPYMQTTMPMNEAKSPQVNALTNNAVLTRIYNKNETLGDFTAHNDKGETLHLKVLELPNLNNQHNISCIPEGDYVCSMRPFHNSMMYQILNVLNRFAVFQHVGNYAAGKKIDTEGCQLFGDGFTDINADGIVDIVNSTKSIAKLNAFFGGKDYKLKITHSQ